MAQCFTTKETALGNYIPSNSGFTYSIVRFSPWHFYRITSVTQAYHGCVTSVSHLGYDRIMDVIR